MEHVSSFSELSNRLKDLEKAWLLIYKKGAGNSDCALKNIASALQEVEGIRLFLADVGLVYDIHPQYGIITAPSLLELESGKLKNVIKGCNNTDYYKALFEEAVYAVESKKEGKQQPRVTVYSTPTCSWCNTLKAYLKKNNVRFTDVDVSRDQKAADELVRRSGQMGVPQTDINGEIIVGFNQTRINQLLNIQ